MATDAARTPIRSTVPARLDMIIGGIVELLIGINAEGKSLETVTRPLTSTQDSALTPDSAI